MAVLDFATGFLMLSSIIAGQGTSSSQSTSPIVKVDRTVVSEAKFVDYTRRESIAAYVQEYFTDSPVLAEIARCESTYRHLGLDGNVLRGNVNSNDVGVMQINETYHKERAEGLGFDLHTLEGNLAYAKYLYEKQGVRPWKSSSKCWSEFQS
ncbi:MAG TPA: hypothetical protein VJH94_00985 [Candidatus Paceibacterota bacterium]